MSLGRLARAVGASATFVSALIAGNYYAHKQGVNSKLPTPLPEVSGTTTDEKVADIIHRYSRIAPVYDELLDKVESKYNGFNLRRNLLKNSRGHVLEIGVGTARNLPFYSKDSVTSLTFVDSTYPMINGAIVKTSDMYKTLGHDALLLASEQGFPFQTNHHEEQQQKQILRPQIVFPYPIVETAKPKLPPTKESDATSLSDTAQAHIPPHYTIPDTLMNKPTDVELTDIISRFPNHVKKFFATAADLSLQSVQELSLDTNDNNHHQDETSSSSSPSSKKDGNKPQIAPEEQGSLWKQYTSTANLIPCAYLHLDCHDLDFFPANTYDTVVDTFGLCSYHDPVHVLEQMRRICKPGGRILLLEHGLGTSWPMNAMIKLTQDQHYKQWGCDRGKDIVGILSKAGYDMNSVSREHGGSTIIYNAPPIKSFDETFDYHEQEIKSRNKWK